MVARTILRWPDKNLRLISEEVKDFDSTPAIAQDLLDTMKANFGLGIAASQVGILKKIVVIDSGELKSFKEDDKMPGAVVFVNPTLAPIDKSSVISQEACLSVPGVSASVDRYSSVSVEYFDLSGNLVKTEATGRDSCILQHEFDHLKGKLFIDRLSSLKKRMVENKLRKNLLKIKKVISAASIDERNQANQNRKRKIARAERKRKRKAARR